MDSNLFIALQYADDTSEEFAMAALQECQRNLTCDFYQLDSFEDFGADMAAYLMK